MSWHATKNKTCCLGKVSVLFLVVHMLRHMFRKVSAPAAILALCVDLENELHNTYGKMKTACNGRPAGSRPFALKDTHSSPIPPHSFAILAHHV